MCVSLARLPSRRYLPGVYHRKEGVLFFTYATAATVASRARPCGGSAWAGSSQAPKPGGAGRLFPRGTVKRCHNEGHSRDMYDDGRRCFRGILWGLYFALVLWAVVVVGVILLVR